MVFSIITTYFRLIRPVNFLITALTVIVGAILVGGAVIVLDSRTFLAALSAALVAGGGNAINDSFDVEIDKRNRPNRPIPMGEISYNTARRYGILLCLTGIITGMFLTLEMGIIAISVSILLWCYSSTFKKTILTGNIIVSICGGLAFIYGALAAGDVQGGIIPAFFAFFIHLAREIVKDGEDLKGDQLAGARTLPIVMGTPTAKLYACASLAVLVLFTFLPVILGIYGKNYLVAVVLLADIPIVIIGLQLLFSKKEDVFSQVSKYLKLVMVGGLIALYFGAQSGI